MVTTRAWCRVDLAGGTLDIWPLGLFHPGARTVNLAIDIAATVRLERHPSTYEVVQEGTAVRAATAAELSSHPEGALVGVVAAALGLPPMRVELASDSPRGGGLGGSSALVVALLAAAEEELDLPRSSPRQRVHAARDLEARLMGLPTGIQDHYPALLGGALEISHEPGGERVRSIETDLATLGEHLVLVYSGQSHFSAGNNWQVVRRRLDGEAEVTGLFEGIASAAARMVPALESGDLPRAGALMSEEWSFRRRLAPGIATPVLDALHAAALDAGAWGGKACGAGGGGCLAFLVPRERKADIESRLRDLAAPEGRVLAARPAAEPLLLEHAV